ncbi:MAG: DNA polymerase III subunit alpha [Actinomycetota bacterium]
MFDTLRTDPSFVHLDVRSFFSLKEGAFSPEQLVRAAAGLGMPAVALTDRDGLYGAARFVAACEREGVRPILGASFTLADSTGAPGRSAGSLVLLATDDTGYANLCRLVTDAHMTGERGAPSLEPAQLCAHAGGLLALAGPASPAGRFAIAGRSGAARRWLDPLREAFGRERLFVGIEHRLERGSDTEIRTLLQLAETAGVRAVATNPVRYLTAEDAFLTDVLECMREIVPLAAHHVSRRNAEGWLKPAAVMRELFAQRPDLCDATLEISERCRFDLGLRRLHFPSFPVPAGGSADAILAERCHRGFDDRGVPRTREATDRLAHELSMIRRMGYASYFLTVADIVADVRAMGIGCACRGSAAGSFVCYLLRISDVDALRHDLVFERFLNPLRDELPDVDIDVESARREDVYDMVLARHGEERTACVAMIDTYRARSALREVGKALGLPEVEVGTIAKAFPHISARNLSRAIAELPELVGENVKVPQLELLFRVAERLDGFPRHIALHPCGIVLSDDALMDRVPIERSFRGYRTVQADKDDVELLGYLKLDVLGVRMLSSMRHALGEIARTEGVKVDLDEIPYDDEATFELIRASDTIGCFQIESPGQRELLQRLQPIVFDDLIVDISLFRPGPVKSDMIRPFLRRRHGEEPPRYDHPSLEPALCETWGVIVYHEQVMRTIAALAGYDLSEADRIRRQLGVEELLPVLGEEFLARTDARGIDRAVAERVWDDLSQFASFGFCKAHAAAFAVPTYRSSWLKAHYPAHLLAGILTHDPGMYPRRLIVEDARQRGIEILPLDVNVSEPDYVVEEVGTTPGRRWGIRLALQDVHGISEAEIGSIMAARVDRAFRDVPDFLRRTSVARPIVEAIAHAGGFDALRVETGTRRNRLFEAITTPAEREGDQLDLFSAGHAALAGEAPLRDYTDAEVVRAELEVLGVDATRHLMSFYEPLLIDLGAVRAADLWKRRGGRMLVAGVKVASQTPAVRSGQRIIFLTLDDATGPVDITVFESVQPKVARTVFHGSLLAVWGQLRRSGVKGVSIIAEEVWDLTDLARARGEGRLEEAIRSPRRTGTTTTGSPGPSLSRLRHASGGSAG